MVYIALNLVALGRDPAVRFVTLTGAGKSFCAGADISDLLGDLFGRAAEQGYAAFKIKVGHPDPERSVALLQGLEGQADLNTDGYITASELFAYVGPTVSSLSRQTPAFGSMPGSEGGEFILELKRDGEFLSEASEQLEWLRADLRSSSDSACPRARMQISNCSITSCWPMITLATSWRICCQRSRSWLIDGTPKFLFASPV